MFNTLDPIPLANLALPGFKDNFVFFKRLFTLFLISIQQNVGKNLIFKYVYNPIVNFDVKLESSQGRIDCGC